MSAAPKELQTHPQSRAAIYGFISWLYLKPPDIEFVTRLLANELQDSLHIFATRSESSSRMLEGLSQMSSSLLVNGPNSLADVCLALSVEYTRLLRGVGRSYGPPPPYESLYRSEEASEDNAFLLQLTELYYQAQAAIRMEDAERVDYLGIELDFMRLLCEEESQASAGDEPGQAEHFSRLQQRFLREHILVWAPPFCERFIAQTKAGFYRGVAQLLLGFLEAESAFFEAYQVVSQEPGGKPGQVLVE